VLSLPQFLAVKAEALHLADRTSEALEAINEAEALAERFEQRWYCAELHRLRGVFLATLGADETQIEASFCEAIRIAKEQKSVSVGKRAEGTRNTVGKKRTRREDLDSGCLFSDAKREMPKIKRNVTLRAARLPSAPRNASGTGNSRETNECNTRSLPF
jgi:hypothetical protein